MRPFFKYFGSKWELSGYYPLPQYQKVCEPFAGSACYSTRHYAHEITLVERDPEIAALWRYLIGASRNDILALPTIFREGENIKAMRNLPIGARLLIRQWQRVGMNTCWTVSKWCKPGIADKHGFWGKTVRDRIAEQVAQIKHWHIIEADTFQIISPENANPATYFIDGPYQHWPQYGSSRINFTEFGRWVQKLRGQTIVCESGHADWLPFREFKRQATGRRNGRYSNELIYTQYK